MAGYEEARRSSLPIQPGTRGSASFGPVLSGNTREPPSNIHRSDHWPSSSSRQHDSSSSESQDDSESDPSSGQEASPDYSDTDSSSGEATITAGPTSNGNLIGRAAASANWRRHGGADSWFDEREDGTEGFQAGGTYASEESRWTAPTSSSSLTRTRSNPTGSANQVHQARENQGWSHSASTTSRNVRNGPSYELQRKDSVNRRWRPTAPTSAESPRNHQTFSTAIPPHPAASAITVQYMYSHSATLPTTTSSSHSHHPSLGETTYSVPKTAQNFSRTKQSSATSLAVPIKANGDQESRLRNHEAPVSRTASLPRMSRLHGFSPITSMTSLKDEPDKHIQSYPSALEAAPADDTSDQEGIYMDVTHSRRRRSLRRRKAASDGSRTPVSPAMSLIASVSPPLSSVSSSLNASPISNILGHASYKKNTVPGDYQHNYAARTELKKRRGEQPNAHQTPQASHSAYAYHIPPRLAHQPRSDFSVASTSGGSADVSSGYTGSADSGDARSDVSLDSPGALGLSLGEASDTTKRHRMQSRLTQDSTHTGSVADSGQWDSTYTDTAHSPSPILSAFETDLPPTSLPPLAIGLAQSSRFPMLILMLRLLAVVPATLGALRLMWDAVLPASTTLGHVGHSAGDNLMSLPWAALTGMFCFELTTGLTHRWLLYYSLAPTLLRLVSLQSICWPSTFITLKYFGDFDILFAWIVVATTTACSRSIQIWVTSNVPEVSRRTLKPAALALVTGTKAEPGSRGGKDVVDRSREAFDKNRKKSRQAVNIWMRERYWDWNQIIGAVWIRVGILYIVTTAYLIGHRHL